MGHASDELDEDIAGSGAEEYSGGSGSHGNRNSKRPAPSNEEGPACQSCRKKKAKCSRLQPCSQCLRYNVDCVYDDRKLKPGLRTGAIENLSQRLETLESMFLGQSVIWDQIWKQIGAKGDQLVSESGWCPSGLQNLQHCTFQLKENLVGLGAQQGGPKLRRHTDTSPTKRQRLDDSEDRQPLDAHPHNLQPETMGNGLPQDSVVDSLVDIYFARVHPWIPMLHVRQFREKMADPTRRKRLTTIFHAIVSLCTRFSDDARLGGLESRARLAKQSRQTVILQSMESFSVENLQALIICAFDTIGSGRGPSAWSIVGSMTRTVEQLQLSVEDEDRPQSAKEATVLIQRMAFLQPPADWREVEERRRIFWNVFLMDRFCSMATGWNLSLTSADVKRRLPCEGAMWEEGQPLQTPTPYFGVSDKPSKSNSSLPSARPESEDEASLGGFAYCIEATESLNLVTSFFLQQAVDVSKVQDVQMWIMKFKQLDLRLIQWKMFLPEKWKNACALNADGNMDPNLTLAHITHNTAVVLLHQGIAYLSTEWQSTPIRLPSASSAETCLAAATEVAIIAMQFLQCTSMVTNPQFAFCLFICGRMLLAHASYYAVPLSPEFDSLLNSLWEISGRWTGPHALSQSTSHSDNLASKFAMRLAQARSRDATSVDISQAAFSEDQANRDVSRPNERGVPVADGATMGRLQGNYMSPMGQHLASDPTYTAVDSNGSPDSITLAFPPLPLAFQPQSTSAIQTHTASPMAGSGQNGTAMYNEHGNGDFDLGSAMDGFQGLDSFWEDAISPNHRISVFSQFVDKDTQR